MTDYRPLSNVSVVVGCTGVAARYCARLFAVMGATVTQLGASGDDRLAYGGAAGVAFGRWLDQDKYVVAAPALDAAFAALAGPLSLVIVDDQSIPEDGPLVLDISSFGHDGPYADWLVSAPLLQALSGTAFNFGAADGAPLLAQGHQAEIISGTVAFVAAAAALLGRMRGHATRRIEVTDFESELCFAEVSAIDPAGRGKASSRLGINRFVPTYPCGVYPSADGWIGVTALTLVQWKGLCGLIGRPELGDLPHFATPWQRLQCADEIDAILAGPLKTRTTEEWVQQGIALRLPFSPVLDQAGLLEAPMWRDRDAFAEIAPGDLMAPTLPFHVRRFAGDTRPLPGLPADAAGPLAGVKVVDFTMGWAGPLATRHLGDLGAEVVKIESVDYPDWWRGWDKEETADPPPHEIKLPFMAVNRNKRGISLDLRTPEGMASARRLIAAADIVIDNFAPGTLDKLGLDMAHRRSLRPDVINVAMGAFGASGPWSGIRGYGSTVEQASGLPFVNGFDAWQPTMQHVAYGDPIAGLFGAVAALAAMIGRDATGGVDIDLSQVECLFQMGADAFVAVQISGQPVARRGSRRDVIAPCGAFPVEGEDEWIAIAVDGEDQWARLCALLGRDDWAGDAGLSTPAGRNARADEIEAALADWSRPRNQEDAVAMLQKAGVGAAPLLRGGDLLVDRHLTGRHFWQEVDRIYIGRHWQAAAPYKLDGVRPAIRRVPPVLGQHTDEVLVEFGVTRAA